MPSSRTRDRAFSMESRCRRKRCEVGPSRGTGLHPKAEDGMRGRPRSAP
ncbi:Hypothetical protein A7982_10923 [Minicystis rosea]|nr:Hypothetical protein A7982_10923 [Minicystis rosea]